MTRKRRRKGPVATETQVISALEGRTLDQAARTLDYSLSGFVSLIKMYGIDTGRRLTKNDSQLIVDLIDAGISRAEVAKKFDRTEETISVHYHRVTGRYLPTERIKTKNSGGGGGIGV